MSDHHELATVETEVEPFPDPGLPEHEPRPTDVDEAAERRAERQVASLFGLSTVFMILFIASYFTFSVGEDPSTFGQFGASNMALGVTFGLALLCIGVGAIQWARKLMGDHEIVEYRHSAGSSDEDKTEVLADLNLGIEESGIGRRPLIRNSLLGAVGRARDRRDHPPVGPRPHRHRASSTTRSGRRGCASSRTSTAPTSSPRTWRSGSWSTPSRRSSTATEPRASRSSSPRASS